MEEEEGARRIGRGKGEDRGTPHAAQTYREALVAGIELLLGLLSSRATPLNPSNFGSGDTRDLVDDCGVLNPLAPPPPIRDASRFRDGVPAVSAAAFVLFRTAFVI